MDERATALTRLLRMVRDRRAALAGLAGISVQSAAGNRRRRKRRSKDRCHRVTRACNRPSDCCGTLACEPVTGLAGERCCRRQGEGCSGVNDCCGFLFCTPAGSCEIPDSDRALKANFASVDPVDMLGRVARLTFAGERGDAGAPVARVRPNPGDFAELFGVGADERRIHVVDAQGVVLAAIQGAARLTAELNAESAALQARLDALE